MDNHRRILLVTSDKHGGHKLGLMNPNVVLYDEDEEGNLYPYTPEPTRMQIKIWEVFTKALQATAQFAAGAPIVSIDLGDMTHGDGYANGLVSTCLG